MTARTAQTAQPARSARPARPVRLGAGGLLYRTADAAGAYVGHLLEYPVCDGFPQTAQVDSITQVRRLLRKDIIDKVLKRDMTALSGVRRVLGLEHTFSLPVPAWRPAGHGGPARQPWR